MRFSQNHVFRDWSVCRPSDEVMLQPLQDVKPCDCITANRPEQVTHRRTSLNIGRFHGQKGQILIQLCAQQSASGGQARQCWRKTLHCTTELYAKTVLVAENSNFLLFYLKYFLILHRVDILYTCRLNIVLHKSKRIRLIKVLVLIL